MGGRYIVLGQVPLEPEELHPLELETQETVDCRCACWELNLLPTVPPPQPH